MTKPQKDFLVEEYNPHKKRTRIATFIIIGISLILICSFISYVLFTHTALTLFHSATQASTTNITPQKLLLFSFFGGIFFTPIPLELPFFKAMIEGQPILFSLLMIFIGLIPSQTINYFLGASFGKLTGYFVSKRKLYKTRSWMSKHGALALFVFNAIPILPAPFASFAVGITKYNLGRFYIITILGNLVRFGIIIAIALIF